MPVRILEVGPDQLPLYGTVPSAFRVEAILQVQEADGGLGGLILREEPVAAPYVKDYDVYETPAHWAARFDVTNWAFFIASDDGQAVGAAAVAVDTPGVHMLEGRSDLAVLWDIRVHPERRGEGIGTALFGRAAGWARGRGCRELKIETQNTNVRACRFYAARGCRLGAIVRRAYREPEIAHEAMLLWYLDLLP